MWFRLCYNKFYKFKLDIIMSKKEELLNLFSDYSSIIKNALSINPDGNKTKECLVLLKDLAHVGGTTNIISIMKAGTVFRKLVDREYYSDGFHLPEHVSGAPQARRQSLISGRQSELFGANRH